ncbi:hypothetical protein ACIP98_31935 [Streptomyces sp. NPDC088354]|uniref:hypothetical protein n=1 Tax=Streptomyces sp. NPDC088354 TaxID=3365856 RepID=UPI00381D16AE
MIAAKVPHLLGAPWLLVEIADAADVVLGATVVFLVLRSVRRQRRPLRPLGTMVGTNAAAKNRAKAGQASDAPTFPTPEQMFAPVHRHHIAGTSTPRSSPCSGATDRPVEDRCAPHGTPAVERDA